MVKSPRIGFILSLMMVFLIGALGMSFGYEKGEKAPDFTLKSLSGKNIKLSEMRGRVVLVNFWATWCAPCKKELPYFNHLYEKYKRLGLEILGVNIDKIATQAKGMSTSLDLSFPVLLDPSGQTSDLYQIRSMPTTFVIAKDGTLRHVHWGFGPMDPARYEMEIRELLKE